MVAHVAMLFLHGRYAPHAWLLCATRMAAGAQEHTSWTDKTRLELTTTTTTTTTDYHAQKKSGAPKRPAPLAPALGDQFYVRRKAVSLAAV